MMTLLRSLPVIALLAILTACTSRLAFVAEAVRPTTGIERIAIDGEAFTLVSHSTGGPGELKPVFFIGGSGCASLRTYLATYFAAAPPGLKIVALEKTGVPDGAIGARCRKAFWESYTFDELLRRNRIALALVADRHASKPIGLMGVSEGGALAVEIAAKREADALSPTFDRLAVVGAGGLSQRDELRELFGTDGEAQLATIFGRIAADPQSVVATELGLPNRYWSSVLDRDPADYAGRINVPTLIVIGERDRNVPVRSARIANELIPNSQLIVWPEATHTFDTPNGSQRGAVIERVGAFLLGR